MSLIASYKDKSKAQSRARKLRKDGKRIQIKRTHDKKSGVWYWLSSY